MRNSNGYKQLSPKELYQWLEENRSFCLIDTLVADHYRRIHLPHSTNACVFEVTFINQVKAITEDRDAEIVLYGSSTRSMDAFKAADKLEQEGYRHINVLSGGIEAWRSAGLTLEGEAVDEPDDPQTLLKLEDRSYRVDTNQSTIEWTGRNPNTSHFGNIKIATGQLAVKNGIITGTFDIDMNSITNINLEGDELQPVLVAHLESDDFFLTKLFPTAKFKILSSTPVKEPFLSIPNHVINGTLELRGVKAQQDFMATVTKTTENGLVAEAHFDIDRTRWSIIYGSARFFEHLGMHLVFDLISFQVRIVAF
jgi:polyisoprenoid-binding protein YceI/rhodanese-related sulfurtransferase